MQLAAKGSTTHTLKGVARSIRPSFSWHTKLARTTNSLIIETLSPSNGQCSSDPGRVPALPVQWCYVLCDYWWVAMRCATARCARNISTRGRCDARQSQPTGDMFKAAQHHGGSGTSWSESMSQNAAIAH